MSEAQGQITELLGKLKPLTSAGYAIGLQITYTTPKFMFQTYDKKWLDHYSSSGLLMSDPTLGWGFENTGAVRWAELVPNDPAGVIALAAEYGVKHGITCARESSKSDGIRSIGSFARADRDYTDEEMAEVHMLFQRLHDQTEDQAELDNDTVTQLKKMSIMVTHPGS